MDNVIFLEEIGHNFSRLATLMPSHLSAVLKVMLAFPTIFAF